MRVFAASLLAVGLFSGAQAQAGECGYDFCWGAVGIGPGGVWGWWAGASSEHGAVSGVQSECPDCDNIQTFYNTCGAIAESQNGAWGSGWGDTQAIAEGFAVQKCHEYSSGQQCYASVWACSY